MERLSQRYRAAIVTGASSGLGYAFAEMLLAEGVRVFGMSRRPDAFPERELYTPVVCDLSDLAEVESVFERLFLDEPEVSLVINNAGFGILDYLSEMPAESVRQQYAVMLEAPTLIAGKAVAHFDTHGGGCLVNVSSLAVELPLPLMAVYNACKAGLSGLSESLLLDGVGKDYRVIDFRPGDFNTPFAERMEGSVEWNGVDIRKVFDAHHARAPAVATALPALRRALLHEVSGTVRVGDFFQSKIAPLGRFLPQRWLRALIRWYYKH